MRTISGPGGSTTTREAYYYGRKWSNISDHEKRRMTAHPAMMMKSGGTNIHQRYITAGVMPNYLRGGIQSSPKLGPGRDLQELRRIERITNPQWAIHKQERLIAESKKQKYLDIGGNVHDSNAAAREADKKLKKVNVTRPNDPTQIKTKRAAQASTSGKSKLKIPSVATATSTSGVAIAV